MADILEKFSKRLPRPVGKMEEVLKEMAISAAAVSAREFEQLHRYGELENKGPVTLSIASFLLDGKQHVAFSLAGTGMIDDTDTLLNAVREALESGIKRVAGKVEDGDSSTDSPVM